MQQPRGAATIARPVDDQDLKAKGEKISDDFDIFISYASASNELPAPFDNWVSHFVDALRRMLRAQLGGLAPRIYFDLRTIEANQELRKVCKTSGQICLPRRA